MNNSALQVLKEHLLTLDELTVIDILDISLEDLIEAFSDRIEDNYDKIQANLSIEEEDERSYSISSWED